VRSGLQDLAGEVARIRAEANHLLGVLDTLDGFANNRAWLSEAQEAELDSLNLNYGRSAHENLGHATADLLAWARAVSTVMSGATTHLAY
jgi:hypothetical protein